MQLPTQPGSVQYDIFGVHSYPNTVQGRFEKFHAENPHVYVELVAMTRRWLRGGRTRASIAMFFEVMRYNAGISTSGSEGYKLANALRSRYARMIEELNPDLRGVFMQTKLRSP